MCSSGWTEFLSRKNNDDEHAKERRQQTVATKYCEKKSVRKRKEVGSDVSLLFGWGELLFRKIAVNRRPWWDTHYGGVNWWQLKIYLFWNLLLISGLCCRHRSLGCQKTDWLKQIQKDGAWKPEFTPPYTSFFARRASFRKLFLILKYQRRWNALAIVWEMKSGIFLENVRGLLLCLK